MIISFFFFNVSVLLELKMNDPNYDLLKKKKKGNAHVMQFEVKC